MATASPHDAALQDLLERLYAAGVELDAVAEPSALADRAAALAMRLTRSTHVELAIGERVVSHSVDGPRDTPGNTARAEIRLAGQVHGTVQVMRAAPYADYEQQALAIFASQVASAIAGARQIHRDDPAELAHERAVQMLLDVSSHALADQGLSNFYSRLAGTVGDIVGAQKVLFWELRDDGMLAPNSDGSFGLERSFLKRLAPIPCSPDGADLAGKIVYHDLIFRAEKSDPAESQLLEALGVANVICVPWRAGDSRLGMVAAYDSVRPEGFTREDTWVLQKAGLSAGLVTRLWHAQDELKRSLDRLVKVDSARQLLLKNMTTVVDKERKRFVSDLHDDAMQKLTAAELQLARLKPGGKVDADTLHTLRGLLDETEAALRRLVFEARPPSLEAPDGLAQSIRDRLAMLSASGVKHDLEFDVPELDSDYRTMIFREVAEAIGNVERHAKASHVKVSLTLQDGGVLGVVQDDGQGFDVAERTNLPGHLGLLALRERALMAGGRYRIESKPGAGTRIEFWIPLKS